MATEIDALAALSACAAAEGVREGRFSAEELVTSCLQRIDQSEAQVQAWTYLDPEHALKQARSADEMRAAGRALGPLHGVPVGIKDIIDTRDMPTEDGTALHSGRMAGADATVVARLRRAGAVILGKTVTTELATYAPGKTRNPYNPAHTPGGSSSGSAAAVAAGMVPLALGTQTNGSVIRPAAFCGVFGFKPSLGLVSRHGVLRLSPTLDQPGVFARCVEDLALITEVLAGADENDASTRDVAHLPLSRVCAEEPPLPPRLALMRSPFWEETAPALREGFAELAAELGPQLTPFELPKSAAEVQLWHRQIMEAEMAANLIDEYQRGREKLSPSLRAQLERGRAMSAFDYLEAKARIDIVGAGLDDLFEEFDAFVTPAAAGAAPLGLESTGDPKFCTLWSYCGLPALNLPLLRDENGMPIGVQLVGRRNDDARLLRTARWLWRRLAASEGEAA